MCTIPLVVLMMSVCVSAGSGQHFIQLVDPPDEMERS